MAHNVQTQHALATVQAQPSPQYISLLLALVLTFGFVAQSFVFTATASAATPSEAQVVVVEYGNAPITSTPLQMRTAFSLPELASTLTQAIRAYLPSVSATANTVYQCILEPEGNVQ